MLSEHQLNDLITLVRRRYEDWEDFDHPAFVADEIEYKQATVAKAEPWLGLAELDRLIAAGDFDTFIERLVKLTQDNNLLWRRVPSQGDTAVLHHPDLDPATFCTAVRNLLYGDRASPERLQSFAAYLDARDLPNTWPLPTYLLFITHPEQEIFVKPRTATWFLKFMGRHHPVTAPPEAAVYATLLTQIDDLYDALLPFGVHDMVDVQSFIWVCYRESKGRIGRLDERGQVDLDVPPTRYQPPPGGHRLREPDAEAAYDVTAAEPTTPAPPAYSLADCAAETGFPTEKLARWVKAIERKGQAIFYGPPGTGKTFTAEKLARHLVGGGDGFVELVQFHPAYAYEDFIQGIRPLTQQDGRLHYEMVPGRFLQFCRRARRRNGRCLLIIDEINRANIAGVFGELMYLLEYRDQAIPLAGGGAFRIPANVRLIGTMNTADRSIALVDHALRRRFAFIHLGPDYDLLRHYHRETEFDPAGLIATLEQLNATIGDPHYYVGPAFFMRPHLADHLADIWRMEIEPYLKEYFFNQADRVAAFRWEQVKKRIWGIG